MKYLNSENIPCINLSHLQEDSPEYNAAILKIKTSCLNPGFFCLENLSSDTEKMIDVTASRLEQLHILNHLISEEVKKK